MNTRTWGLSKLGPEPLPSETARRWTEGEGSVPKTERCLSPEDLETRPWPWDVQVFTPSSWLHNGKVSTTMHAAGSLLCVRLFATTWTVAQQAPRSMRVSRQECWRRFPCSPPGDLPDPGVEPKSLMSPALAGRFFTTRATWEALFKT